MNKIILITALLFSYSGSGSPEDNSTPSTDGSSAVIQHVPIKWQLKKQAQVESDVVTLLDVIEPAKGKELPDIVLQDAPVIGKPKHLHQSKIFQLVEKEFPGLLSPKAEGSLWVKVSRKHRLLEENEFLDLLIDSKDFIFEEVDGELIISLAKKWIPLQVPPGPVILDFEGHGISQPSNYNIIKFSIVSGAGKIGPYFVPVRCQQMREVLVAKESIQRGHLVDGKRFDWKLMDSLALNDPVTRDLLDPTDPMQLVRALKKGSPLTQRDVKRQPMVTRRAVVTALKVQGSLKISIKALSEEEGYKGDVIKVRNMRSNKQFYAKVIDRNIVEPIF